MPGGGRSTGDDGHPDPRLAAAVASYDGSGGRHAEVLAALIGARVYLALEAGVSSPRGAQDPPGTAPRRAEVSMIVVTGADGRRALPAFTDGRTVDRWRAEARPLPVTGAQACASALASDCDVLLIDPGPAAVVLSAAEITELSHGRVPVLGSRLSTRRMTDAVLRDPAVAAAPDLLAAIGDALIGEPVAGARLLAGPDGPVVGIVLHEPLSPADLAALAERVARRLTAVLPADGMDLAVVAAEGPGQPITPRRR